MFDRPDSGDIAVLVHIKYPRPKTSPDFDEFAELAVSAGVTVVSRLIVPKDKPDPKYLIGTGKLEELGTVITEKGANVVLINHPISPGQQKNLENHLKVRVLDRTGLILDVFAQRARTYEGKLQVELAQLQYLSTRLIRGWTHLERQKGGIGLRGPGETQLEIDRRLIRERVKHLTDRLDKVQKQRAQGRRARKKANLPTVSLVGYTNAGKSTLFNVLTGDKVYAADKLFATLDPTIRSIELHSVGKVIVSDTVGFIRDLPHNLIEAFKATLEETLEADLLLHVIDIADEQWRERQRQVESVLSEIGALNVPILEVYNKIDVLDNVEPSVDVDHLDQISGVFVSAAKSSGIDLLKESIATRLAQDSVSGQLALGPEEGKLRAALYEAAAVDNEYIDEDGNFNVFISMPGVAWQRLCRKFPGLKGKLQQI